MHVAAELRRMEKLSGELITESELGTVRLAARLAEERAKQAEAALTLIRNRKDADETAARLRGHGATLHLLDADVSKYESVEAMMKQVAALTGGLDILVNNAGILRDRTVRR